MERLRLGGMQLSRVTLLEAYLEAWEQPSHVCGVIWDKIKECSVREKRGDVRGKIDDQLQEPNTGQQGIMDRQEYNLDRHHVRGEGISLRELHRYFPDYQVWDRSFQIYLQRHQMAREWLRVWRMPVFDEYGGLEQLQALLDNVEGWQKLSQVLVLGYSPDLSVWLPRLARRARRIDFYLDYEPRGMEELQEWIEEEYGLVAQWRILESHAQTNAGQEAGQHTGQQAEPQANPQAGQWEKLPAEQRAKLQAEHQREQREKSQTESQENGEAGNEKVGKLPSYPGLSRYLRSYGEPCLVLDFTKEADIPVTGLKPGSMWWDLGAMEEKRHLLEDRPLGVRYVSMRTLWRDSM